MTDAVLRRCFSRMSNWVAMVIESVRAEYPAWELMQSVSIFNLGCRDPSNPCAEMRNQAESVQRLAQCCNVSARKLTDQLHDAIPFACKMFGQQQASSSSAVAWMATMKKMVDRRLREHHPVSALGPVLQRYVALQGCSTGDTERGLGVLNKCLGKHRTQLDTRTQLGELKMFKDIGQMSVDVLVSKAQNIWSEVFGDARDGAAGSRSTFTSRKLLAAKDCR